MSRRLTALIAPVLCALPLSLAACGGDDSPGDPTTAQSPAASGGSGPITDDDGPGNAGDTGTAGGDCTPVDGELVDANRQGAEPTFSVPMPEDWQRSTVMDSEIIRLMIGDADDSTGATATVIVTVEQLPMTGEDAFDAEIRGLEQAAVGHSIGRDEPTTTCGFPSQHVHYMNASGGGDPVPARVLIIAVPDATGSGSTVATVTAQSSDPDNAAQQNVLDHILT